MKLAGGRSIDDFIHAVERTSANLAAMTEHIGCLESDLSAVYRAHDKLSADLDEASNALDASGAALQEESSRREQAELLAAMQGRRTDHLETQLANTLDDLARVSDVIADALGVQRAVWTQVP